MWADKVRARQAIHAILQPGSQGYGRKR